MASLLPDARVPRRIAAGYAVLVLAVVTAAAGLGLHLDRRERDRLSGETSRAAGEAARRLGRDLSSALESLPERAADPSPPAPAPLFAERVAVDSRGARTFPPAAPEVLSAEAEPGMEVVEEAERAAREGREPEALEVLDAAARGSSPGVAWAALLATAAVYERSGSPSKAVPFAARAAEAGRRADLRLSARLHSSRLLARSGQAERALCDWQEALEDAAGLLEALADGRGEPVEPAAVRAVLRRSDDLLGGAPPACDGARARIEAALASLEISERIARALAADPGGPGIFTIDSGPVPGPIVVHRRREPGGGQQGIRLRWEAWDEKARRSLSDAPGDADAASPQLRVRLVPPRGHAGEGLAAAVPLGPPPLDALLLEAAPDPEAAARALAGFRLRLGLAVGGATALLLAIAGLGAWNLKRAFDLSRLRAEFALSTSHEIKTPLAVIRAAAETLALRPLGEEARAAYLRTVVTESRRLTELVGRVLDLRRREERDAPPERTPQDLAALAREAVSVFEPLLAGAGMNARADAPGPVPVLAEPESIVNTVLELLENALRYTPSDAAPDRKRIDVRVRCEGAEAVLEVADRGLGIPPAERERVFERYYRIRGQSSGGQRGAGLGLAIVRQVVEAHGGRVSISGNEPVGTTVNIALPLHVERENG